MFAVPSMYKSLNSFDLEPKSLVLSPSGIMSSPTLEKSAVPPPPLPTRLAKEADNVVTEPLISDEIWADELIKVFALKLSENSRAGFKLDIALPLTLKSPLISVNPEIVVSPSNDVVPVT